MQRRIGEIGSGLPGQRQRGEEIARGKAVIVPAIRRRQAPEQPGEPQARRYEQDPEQRIAHPAPHQARSRFASISQARLATVAANIRSAAARITSTIATGVTDILASPAAAMPAPTKIKSLLGTSGNRVTTSRSATNCRQATAEGSAPDNSHRPNSTANTKRQRVKWM